MKYIGIILLSAFLFSCSNTDKEAETTETASKSNVAQLNPQQKKNIGLQLGKLTFKNVSTILKLSGQIDVPPQNMISISIPLGGFLKSTKLLQGMHVRKGQVLAILEDQKYILLQQNYLTTKVKLKQATQDYERQKALNKNLASSDKIFQQASAEYDMLKIQLNSLAQELKLININANTLSDTNISTRIRIISPIDGYVTKVNANIGKHVDTNEILFELVNPDDLHLALTVFEKDAIQLKIGQKLIAYSNDQPNKKYLGEILLVGKDFGTDRSLLVHCHFENEKETIGLIPGMFMNAEVEVKSENTPCLPQDAIVNYEGKDYVFVAKSASNFELTEVKLGSNENGFTAIQNSNFLKNKNVVTHGAYDLLMSLKNTEE